MGNQFVVKKGLIVQDGGVEITGSLVTTGHITAPAFTGSFSGSISSADSAFTASYVSGSNVDGTVVSASYSLTASFSLNGGGSGTSLTTGSTYPITSSWALDSISASYYNQKWIETGSNYPITASWAISASWATNVVNDKMVTTGSFYPITSSWATDAIISISSSYLSGSRSIIGQTTDGLNHTYTNPSTVILKTNNEDVVDAAAQVIELHHNGGGGGSGVDLSTALRVTASSYLVYQPILEGITVGVEGGPLCIDAYGLRIKPIGGGVLNKKGIYQEGPSDANTFNGRSTFNAGITGSLKGTASWAENATPTFTGKSDGYFPKWDTNTLTATSLLYEDSTGVAIGNASSVGQRLLVSGSGNSNGGVSIISTGILTLRLYTTGSPSNTGVIGRGENGQAILINSANVVSFPNSTYFPTSSIGIGTLSALTQLHIDHGTVLTGQHTQGFRLRNTGSVESWILSSGIVGDDRSFGIKRVTDNTFPLAISASGTVLATKLSVGVFNETYPVYINTTGAEQVNVHRASTNQAAILFTNTSGFRGAIGMGDFGHLQFGSVFGLAANAAMTIKSGSVVQVGIGSTDPSKTLDVVGDVRATLSITASNFYSTAGQSIFTRNVGIGTLSASSPLHVRTISAETVTTFEIAANVNVPNRFINSNGYHAYYGMTNTGNFVIANGPSLTTNASITIESSSQHVGIGTTNPDAYLHIYGDGDVGARIPTIHMAAASSGAFDGYIIGATAAYTYDNTTGKKWLFTYGGAASANVVFAVSASGETHVISGGGTNNPIRIGGLIGFAGSSGYNQISLAGSTVSTEYTFLMLPATPDLLINRASGYGIVFRENNVDQMRILTGGNVGIGTITVTNTKLYVFYSSAASTGDTIGSRVSFTNSTAGSQTMYGNYTTVGIGGSTTNQSGTAYGYYTTVTQANVQATASAMYGGYFSVSNDGRGTNLVGIYGTVSHVGSTSDGRLITNSYLLYLNATQGGGSISNQFGIYQAGTSDKNYLGGSVGIGTTSPATSLHVAGDTGISGSRVRANTVNVSGSFGMSGSLYIGAEAAVSAALSGPAIRGWLKVSCPGVGTDPWYWIPVYTGSV